MKEPATILIDQRILDILANVSTATIAMQLFKRGFRNYYHHGVKPLHSGTHTFVAPAFTLRNIPMREDFGDMAILTKPEYPQRKAIETTPPGCCLVSDACSNVTVGLLGDILAERLRVRGVVAVVTDGAVRDAVELQVPIGCAGVAVLPGDIMAGDKDGVLVIPRALAKEIADDAPDQERYEQFARQEVSKGRSIIGLYPASDESRSDYEKWSKDNS